MGKVFAAVTLKNVKDMGHAKDGFIKEDEVRSMTISALVDTGAMSLCITEEIRKALGLEIVGNQPVRVANGLRVSGKKTEPVEVTWKDRFMACTPVIIPGGQHTLLGVTILESLDLIVNPVKEELVGAHGDEWLEMVG